MSSKKKDTAIKLTRYRSRDQQRYVCEIVRYLLNFAKDHGLDILTTETLDKAVEGYKLLTDPMDTPVGFDHYDNNFPSVYGKK